MNSKEILLDRINIFNTIFNQCLTEISFYESSIFLDRLECSNMSFPSNPIAESRWKNKNSHIEFVFRTYENYITDFEIFNQTENQKLSINDFKSARNINNIEVHLMNGNIDEKYEQYLNTSLNFIKKSEIWHVLNGTKWLDIPFEWQGQK